MFRLIPEMKKTLRESKDLGTYYAVVSIPTVSGHR
jgi:hypothetical protein